METNSTLRYEALILAVPEITADESSALESQLQDIVSKNKGEILSFERWGKYRLAYEVRKNEYGVYYLTRFEIPSEQAPRELLEKLRKFFAVKYNELVMRHMFARLESDGSLEYKRPESLEEMPRRDVGSFLKENKMTGLIKTDRRTEAKPEPKVEAVKPLEEVAEQVKVAESQKSKEPEVSQEAAGEQKSTEDKS